VKAHKIPTETIQWEAAVGLFGERCVIEGTAVAWTKVLSDRRSEGGGFACLLRFSPPAARLIKIVAVARSDEHIYILEGGHCNKLGERLAHPGAYGINAEGRPHSAFFAQETIVLAIYRGEPDEVQQFDLIECESLRNSDHQA
jgi:hypothetical protein